MNSFDVFVNKGFTVYYQIKKTKKNAVLRFP